MGVLPHVKKLNDTIFERVMVTVGPICLRFYVMGCRDEMQSIALAKRLIVKSDIFRKGLALSSQAREKLRRSGAENYRCANN